MDFRYLQANGTVTQCPYKGRTSGGWDATVGEARIEDVAWAYDFPTAALDSIKGLIGFLNEKVDIFVEGERQERPEAITPR